MPYPGQFHRLVLIGDLYNDKFATTLSIVPSALGELGMPAVNSATLTAVAGDVALWWPKLLGGGGISIMNTARLESIKLNRIGTDGRYADPDSMEHVYPTAISGGWNGTYAPQVSIAATFATRVPRGRGSHGRMYFPPTQPLSALDTSDGRVAVSSAGVYATGVRELIIALNARYTAIGKVGVASDAGSGLFEHVTHVRVGRVPDTIRSRRSAQVEDYQEVAV